MRCSLPFLCLLVLSGSAATNADNSILYGEIDFTGMEGDFDAPDLSRLKAKFRAASGDLFDTETPYGRCIRQYWQVG